MTNNKVYYDVAVIGAGPAGMMAAGRAGELGKKVVLLEKNKELGAKLLLTGKGRCNITNAEPDLRKLVEKYGKNELKQTSQVKPFFIFLQQLNSVFIFDLIAAAIFSFFVKASNASDVELTLGSPRRLASLTHSSE